MPLYFIYELCHVNEYIQYINQIELHFYINDLKFHPRTSEGQFSLYIKLGSVGSLLLAKWIATRICVSDSSLRIKLNKQPWHIKKCIAWSNRFEERKTLCTFHFSPNCYRSLGFFAVWLHPFAWTSSGWSIWTLLSLTRRKSRQPTLQ